MIDHIHLMNGTSQEPIRWERKPPIDMRWEVSAAPTDEMWEAMRATPIGMADFGEDPTVRELEELGAELLGHEASMLVPTVTIGTVLSMMSGATTGTAVLMEERCHMYWVEQLHVSALAGAAPRLLRGDKFGAVALEQIEAVITERYYGHAVPVSVMCLENTHNICGGTVLTPEYTRAVSDLCHGQGIKVYLDGARLFNAAVAQEVPIDHLAAPADYVVVGLNKALGAPFGSLLAGSTEFIEEAKLLCRRIGAMGMHKAGLYAAACLVALRKMVDRLAEDHQRARRMAEEIETIPGLTVDLETVQTNLVRVETEPRLTSHEVAISLVEYGVAIHEFEPNAFKLALHFEIGDEEVEYALQAIRTSMERLAQGAAVS